MDFLKRLKEDKFLFASIAVFIFAAFVCIAGMIFLPEKIYVQLFSERSTPETPRNLFLLASLFVIALSSLMCFLTDKVRKWVATEVVLAIAFAGCVIYNFFA